MKLYKCLCVIHCIDAALSSVMPKTIESVTTIIDPVRDMNSDKFNDDKLNETCSGINRVYSCNKVTYKFIWFLQCSTKYENEIELRDEKIKEKTMVWHVKIDGEITVLTAWSESKHDPGLVELQIMPVQDSSLFHHRVGPWNIVISVTIWFTMMLFYL